MSHYLTYIQLKPFIAQWLVHTFGDPVRFPHNSPENALLHRRCIKLPRGVQPDAAGEGLTAIAIPWCDERNIRYNNYLPPDGKRELVYLIECLFTLSWRQQLLVELLDPNCKIKSVVLDWCTSHGIDEKYANTIRQRIYRWRSSMHKNGFTTRKRRLRRSLFPKKH